MLLKKKKKKATELRAWEMPDRQLHTEQHLFITWTPGALCCTYLCTEDARLLPWTVDVRRLQNGCLWDKQQARGPRPVSRPVRAGVSARTGERRAARPLRPLRSTAKGAGRGSAPRRFGGRIKTGPNDTKFVIWIRPYMVICFSGVLSRGTRPMTYQSFWTASSVCVIWVQCELLRRACWPPSRKAKQALWNFPHSSGINCLLLCWVKETPENTVISFLLNFSDTNWGKGLLKWTKTWGFNGFLGRPVN